MFNSIGRSSNFAQAGKSAADETVRAFAASRRNAPKYGELAQKAQKLRTEEKIAAWKAESEVATAGIQAQTDVKTNQIKLDAKSDYANAKRKAGALATAGKMFGTAGSFMGEKRDRREVGSEDAWFDEQIKTAEDKAAELRDQAGSIGTDTDLVEPQTGGVAPKVQNAPLPQVALKTTVPNTGGTGSSSTSTTPVGNQAKVTASPDFKAFVDMAAASGAKYPQLVAAQWALESGWGKTPSGKNNYFGIKATSGEAGTSKQTWEVYGGKEVTTSARFKDYASPQGSVNDLVGKWHKDYGNYKGVNNAANAFEAADMLRQQGYATDPAYAEKLKRIMRDQGYS